MLVVGCWWWGVGGGGIGGERVGSGGGGKKKVQNMKVIKNVAWKNGEKNKNEKLIKI